MLCTEITAFAPLRRPGTAITAAPGFDWSFSQTLIRIFRTQRDRLLVLRRCGSTVSAVRFAPLRAKLPTRSAESLLLHDLLE
jgi:hypothetical protein